MLKNGDKAAGLEYIYQAVTTRSPEPVNELTENKSGCNQDFRWRESVFTGIESDTPPEHRLDL